MDPRQHEIEDDQVVAVLASHPQAVGADVGEIDSESLSREAIAYPSGQKPLVLDDQHANSVTPHRSLLAQRLPVRTVAPDRPEAASGGALSILPTDVPAFVSACVAHMQPECTGPIPGSEWLVRRRGACAARRVLGTVN